MKKLVSIMLCLVLLGSVRAYADFPSSVKIDQTFQDGGDLSVIFHASDGSGADLTDITADNVSLTLDGQTLPTRLEPASAGGIGYVFAVDVSAMLTDGQFAAVRESLKSWIGAMGPQDRAAVVAFGAQVTTVTEMTDSVTTLLMALDGLAPADPEAMLCSGAVRAVEIAADQGEGLPLRRAVVLVSDGAGSANDAVDMDAVRTQAVADGIPLYAAQASGEDNGEGAAGLADAVLATGGRVETSAKDTLASGVERLRAYIGSGNRAVAAVPEDLADSGVKTLALTVTEAGIGVSDSRDVSLGGASNRETVDDAEPETAEGEEPESALSKWLKLPSDWDVEQYVPYIAAGCAGALLALAPVLVVSAVKKRKAARKKKAEADVDQGYGNCYQTPPSPAAFPPEGRPVDTVRTVPLEQESAANVTVPLSKPMAGRLVLTDNRNRRAYSAPFQDRVTVGREDGVNQIVLRDEHVSTSHFEIFRDEGRVIVRDLRSTNGTMLLSNGVRYTVDANVGRELHVGDVLEIGRTALEVTDI